MAETSLRDRLHDLVERVPDNQLTRAEQLLSTVVAGHGSDVATEHRSWSVDEVLGIAATDRPPPTDDEVREWLEERRIQKFG